VSGKEPRKSDLRHSGWLQRGRRCIFRRVALTSTFLPMTTTDLRFPVGRFTFTSADDTSRAECISIIAELPSKMRAAVTGLSDAQLDTRYRPEGWTVRQVVHHVPDSHLNAYIRFKLALTEDVPTIKPYDEQSWANLADSKDTPVETSLTLLESLHQRMTILLKSMKPEDFTRQLNHPERGPMTVDSVLALYAWHGPHHVAHVTELRKREGWG
jgi:uncharacterized damage-inducible protein DinB